MYIYIMLKDPSICGMCDTISHQGVTHKAAYDRFSRQCVDRRKFPVSLASAYCKDKLDLFRAWLEMREDWSKLLVLFWVSRMSNGLKPKRLKRKQIHKTHLHFLLPC